MKDHKCEGCKHYNAGGGAVYGLGFIGAVIYYIQHAGSFAEGLMGVVKAIFWPAMMVYKLLELLKI